MHNIVEDAHIPQQAATLRADIQTVGVNVVHMIAVHINVFSEFVPGINVDAGPVGA